MDKYEFNIKVEQIRKLSNQGDFETAMKIADTIDWKKVRNANLLSMVANVYEKNHEYQDAKEILLMAFERAPIGKRLLYKLTDLALKEGNVEEANAYYREFCDLAGDDPRQHLLRYMILKAMDAPIEQQIHSLEGYTEEELDEKWLYELADLYHRAGDAQRCVAACDKIMLMFGLGKYVDKAMELKIQYAPLNKYQMDLVENRDKYEEKLRAVEQAFEEEDTMDDEEESSDQEPVSGQSAVTEHEPEETETPEESEVVAEEPAEMEDEEIEKLQSSLREVFYFLKYAGDWKKLEKILTDDERFQSLETEAATVIRELTNTEIEIKEEQEEQNMCKAIEQMKEKERKIGLEDGKRIGLEDGKRIGLEDGKRIGRELGEAEIILRMYQKGYGSEQIAEMTDMEEERVKAIICMKLEIK